MTFVRRRAALHKARLPLESVQLCLNYIKVNQLTHFWVQNGMTVWLIMNRRRCSYILCAALAWLESVASYHKPDAIDPLPPPPPILKFISFTKLKPAITQTSSAAAGHTCAPNLNKTVSLCIACPVPTPPRLPYAFSSGLRFVLMLLLSVGVGAGQIGCMSFHRLIKWQKTSRAKKSA